MLSGIEILRKKISVIGSPHYYHGTSVIKLLLHNIVLLAAYFRTESPENGILNPTSEIKNSKKGKIALILGTGPSVDRLNADQIALHIDDLFAMNEFFTLKVSASVTPQYYCLSDPAHFSKNSEYPEEKRIKLREYLDTVKPTLLLPHWSNKSFEFVRFSKLYFDDREFSWMRKNISPTKPRAYSSATLYKALAMACHMGYEKIYILGLDNTNFRSYKGTLINLVVDTSNHTAEVSDSENLENPPSLQLKFTSGMAGRMQSFAKLFGDLGFFPKDRIINLSVESLVDVFQKVENHPLVS